MSDNNTPDKRPVVPLPLLIAGPVYVAIVMAYLHPHEIFPIVGMSAVAIVVMALIQRFMK